MSGGRWLRAKLAGHECFKSFRQIRLTRYLAFFAFLSLPLPPLFRKSCRLRRFVAEPSPFNPLRSYLGEVYRFWEYPPLCTLPFPLSPFSFSPPRDDICLFACLLACLPRSIFQLIRRWERKNGFIASKTTNFSNLRLSFPLRSASLSHHFAKSNRSPRVSGLPSLPVFFLFPCFIAVQRLLRSLWTEVVPDSKGIGEGRIDAREDSYVRMKGGRVPTETHFAGGEQWRPDGWQWKQWDRRVRD